MKHMNELNQMTKIILDGENHIVFSQTDPEGLRIGYFMDYDSSMTGDYLIHCANDDKIDVTMKLEDLYGDPDAPEVQLIYQTKPSLLGFLRTVLRLSLCSFRRRLRWD